MASAGDEVVLVRRTFGDLPPRERVEAYRQMLNTGVGRFDVEVPGDSFDFRATAFALPGLGVAQIESSPVRVSRMRGMAVGTSRDLIFSVVHDGIASIEQRGREVAVRGHGAWLALTHEPLVMQRSAARLTNYTLHSSALVPAISSLDSTLLTAMPAHAEPIRLLIGYTNLLFGDGVPPAEELRALAVRHIHDLVVLALGATRDAAEIARGRGLRAARRLELYTRAERFIALRCDDPDLVPAEIADRLAVSQRLLQKLFAERGHTVMSRIWEERVNRAARLLAAPQMADRSVTDIAFACGFKDSSHFGRVFAARKGTAPARWRKMLRESAAT
jgi:AraC-like DNA-binding protein